MFKSMFKKWSASSLQHILRHKKTTINTTEYRQKKQSQNFLSKFVGINFSSVVSYLYNRGHIDSCHFDEKFSTNGSHRKPNQPTKK